MNDLTDVQIIGLDCAVDAKGVGLVRATLSGGRLRVADLWSAGERTAVETISGWARDGGPALIAIDAPLGWPERMGRLLPAHCAGEPISARPNCFFRRHTDRFIQRTVGKTPLDVGADRIGRTAVAALQILDEVRNASGRSWRLAWSPSDVEAGGVIEVYPAATLLSRGRTVTGFKDPARPDLRSAFIAGATEVLDVTSCDTRVVTGNCDVFDAVICALAAADFLLGRAMPPDNFDLAGREGWIWTAPPLDPPKRKRGVDECLDTHGFRP
jgi:predicted nuclease with RNAse H fold